jgi:hypothetical protein
MGGEGAASAISIERVDASLLRGVLTRSTPESVALDAFELGERARATPLLTLDGPPSLDVALVLQDGTLFFNDDGPEATDKRARRARIAWTGAGSR